MMAYRQSEQAFQGDDDLTRQQAVTQWHGWCRDREENLNGDSGARIKKKKKKCAGTVRQRRPNYGERQFCGNKGEVKVVVVAFSRLRRVWENVRSFIPHLRFFLFVFV